MSFCLLLNTKEDNLKNVCNQRSALAIDFHGMEKMLWKSMATINCFVSDGGIVVFGWAVPLGVAFVGIVCLDLSLMARIGRMKSLGEEWFMTNKIFVLWWNMTDSSVFWFTSQFVLCFAGCFKYFF